MSEMLSSIRADLTDRRMLPVVAIVAACLVAALAYALFGGSSSSSSPQASTGVPAVTVPKGIAVTGATPEHAVAETTDGFKEQASGSARNPFELLHPASAASTTPETSTSGSSSSGAGSSKTETSGSSSGSTGSSGSGSAGGGESKTETKTAGGKKKSSGPVYDVSVEFGTLPPGITPETAQLTPFTNLKLQTPLPNSQTTVLVFRGVTAKGQAATFTIVGEAFPSGTGACLPSAVQCEAVDLKPGETEQFTVIAADGTTTVYELRVLTIARAKTSKGKGAHASSWPQSRTGSELLRKSGRLSLPFLRYSSQPGVLVFAPRKASAARAHHSVIRAVG